MSHQTASGVLTELHQQADAVTLPHHGIALVESSSDWRAIDRSTVALVVEQRDIVHLERVAAKLLSDAPFQRIGRGTPKTAVEALGQLPQALAHDIDDLAQRFASLMSVREVQIRLEAVTSNACRKIHADCTDLRLITTYAGPATQVLHLDAEPAVENLWSMETVWIGLFKGKNFAQGHKACLHRSPPAKDMQAKRLVLVIDTPQFPTPEAVR